MEGKRRGRGRQPSLYLPKQPVKIHRGGKMTQGLAPSGRLLLAPAHSKLESASPPVLFWERARPERAEVELTALTPFGESRLLID